jgi:DNA primase
LPTLLELVQSRVPLKRSGSKWWGACPYHGEKTASFKVEEYRGKWRFHCFGCGASGDAIDWLQRWDRLSYREARERLGQKDYRPAPPTPEELSKRRAAEQRKRTLATYRDAHPDCGCPDWLIA